MSSDQYATVAGIVLENGVDLQAVAENLGGWQYLGAFMYGFGLGLGVIEAPESLPSGARDCEAF